ncbi:hypothetical protein Mgra_00006497 [Meloidogyne graminicola]|uniref:Uncharacterized protein n=1 Tax=Meloidogyne graminicola TaxID=189291 RepID=A0A8S9ZL44_9BILA|nr:hypothetical protein Mgra_00006497 [Meloidogyne graminicola]
MKGKTKLFLINFVFFALFLTLFFDKNEAFNEDNLVEKIQNNLIYAAFPAEPRARYVFNKERNSFKGWRIYQLKNIAELDQGDDKTPRGSTQSNDVLQIEEYLNINKLNKYRPMTDEESVKYPPLGSRQVKHMKNVFKKAVKNLKRKVDFFSGKNFNHFVCNAEQVRGALEKFENDGDLNVDLDTLSFGDSFSPERRYQMFRGRSRHFPNICQCFTPSNFERGETSQQSFEPGNESDCKKLIQLVLDCKIFIKNLHYRGKEGTLIDILSFMKVEELTSLKLIYELSDIQSKKLDEAINSRIYREHLRNEQNNGNKHAIVQGAGPVGLYAAYKLFNGKNLF